MVPFVAVAMPKTSPMKGGELARLIAALDWVFAEAKDCMIEIDGSSIWDQATTLLLYSVREYIAQEVRS